jgi:hypothetical protein
LQREQKAIAEDSQCLIDEQKKFKALVLEITDSIAEHKLQLETKERKAEILFAQAQEFDFSLHKKKVEIKNLSLIEAAKSWSVVLTLTLCSLLIGVTCGYLYSKISVQKPLSSQTVRSR